MTMSGLKRYRLPLLALACNLGLWLYDRETGLQSLNGALDFTLQVFSVVPPVMLCMGLLEVWVPRTLVEHRLGPDSGLAGSALALLLGTAAAGPLYAAFPLGQSLRAKGARLANVCLFLGAFASIKIPMLLMESSFIGLRFSLLRLLLTLPGLLAASYLLERLLGPKEKQTNPA